MNISLISVIVMSELAFNNRNPGLDVLAAVDRHLTGEDLKMLVPVEMVDKQRDEVISALVASAFDPNTNTQLVLWSLGEIGPEALPALRYLLGTLKLTVKEQEEIVLSMERWSESLATLLEIAGSNSFHIDVRLEANEAAGYLLDKEKSLQELVPR